MSAEDEHQDSVPTEGADEVERLVAECLERYEAEGSAAVDVICEANPALAAAIRSALADLEACGMLGGSGGAAGDFPEKLGPFRLIERLGDGGMGIVFVAEQEGLGRRVALKLIRPEYLFFAGARERLKREAEAVARLQHPGIVPIYMVGEEKGLPWFAMELIEGCTLAEVLEDAAARPLGHRRGVDLAAIIHRRANVSPEDAARFAALPAFSGSWQETIFLLLRQIAEALEHAHARGVLHRDVKPSNIMVTPTGRAMLVDFGLARAEGVTQLTHTGSAPGSLPYMAPEQIRGEKDLDQRVDVYGLGVTLYEALSLVLPYTGRSVESIRNRILEARPESLRRHARDVGADAETVALVALDADRHRRYASAADLARDMGRVALGEPIDARRPGTFVRLGRAIRRRPARAAAVLMAILLVTVLPTALLIQSQVAERDIRRERDIAIEERTRAQNRERTARRVKDLLAGLFRAENPSRALGRDLTARQLLDLARDAVRRDLGEEPAIRAELLATLGTTYESMAFYDVAAELFREALDLYRLAPEVPGEVRGPLLISYARWLMFSGRHDEATRFLDEYETTIDGHPEAAATRAELECDRADICLGRDDVEGAERHLARTATILSGIEPKPPLVLAIYEGFRNKAAMRRSDLVAAIEHGRASLDHFLSVYPPYHPQVIATRNNLALAYKLSGRLDEAASQYEQTLGDAERINGPDHDDVAVVLINLATVREEEGRIAEAGASFERAVSIFRKTLGDDDMRTSIARAILAKNLFLRGEYAQAHETYTAIVPGQREKLTGPKRATLAQSLRYLGESLCFLGRAKEAIPFVDDALAEYEKLGPESMISYVETLRLRGHLHEMFGRPEDAESNHRKALSLLEGATRVEDHRIVEARVVLGDSLARHGKREEAKSVYEEALLHAGRLEGAKRIHGARLLRSLFEWKKAASDWDGAIADGRRALEVFRAALGDSNRETINMATSCAMTLRFRGKKIEAVDAITFAKSLEAASGDPQAQDRIDVLDSSLGALLVDLERFDEARPILEALHGRIVTSGNRNKNVENILIDLIIRCCTALSDAPAVESWQAKREGSKSP